MSKVIQAGEFFVVGGPVQPERPCYVERAADQALEVGIRAQRFCYVLGPRAMGKSSLMGRVIRALRREDQLVAVVDLAQIDARGESADAGRWYYSIAHRIVHELRLQVDLPSWWEEKSALSEQRLAEFFWEIVLTNTTAPVTVFFDEIERAQDLPFSQELFAAIRTCYARRARESDYARLNFVVLGVASAERLCPQIRVSPFSGGQSIEVGDFDAAQAYQLAIGFGGAPAQAQALMDRVCVWTGGHPYLTQKVARGVARKGGKLEDVERVVREQFLAAGAAHDEPLLNQVHGVLTDRSVRSRQALALLRRVAKGANVPAQPESAALTVLQLAGVVSVDREQRVHYRNRIFKEAFGRRWINAARPAGWRIAAAVAAFVAVAAGSALWYVEYLPRPYLQTLSATSEDFAPVEAAYQKLRRLPGFAGRADRLFAQAVIRRSDQATTFAEAAATDGVLRGVLGQNELADQLMADFWLRQSRQATHAERRDDALLYALRALPVERARVALAELIGADYRRLERSFDWPEAPQRWAVDWPASRVTGIDSAQRAQRLELNSGSGRETREEIAGADQITVLEYRPVVRELNVAEEGSAGAFELVLSVRHPASGELLLTLTAPSGAQANVLLPQREQEPTFSFAATDSSPLAALADEGRAGSWRLALIDRRTDNSGMLLAWALQFGADREPWRDEPEGGIAIPDAVRTVDVNVEVSANGRFAIARAARPGPVGALALWNLREGRLQSDLQLPAAAQYAELNTASTRLLVVAGDVLLLWNVTDDVAVARVATQTEFVLPPALAPEGEYVEIAERVDGAAPLFSLLSTEDGELLTSVEGVDDVRSWVLGPQARYLALLGAPSVVRVMDPRRGEEWPPLNHVTAVQRLLPVAGSDSLLTVDAAGDIRVWRFGSDSAAPAARVLGTTIDPLSVSVAANGTEVAFAAAGGQVEVRDVADPRRSRSLRIEPSTASATTQLSPDGGSLLTVTGAVFKLWRLNEDESADGAGPEAVALPELSALALDRQVDIAALGFRGGFVRAQDVAELARAPIQPAGFDFIGHRGAVRSLAVNAALGMIVSGGSDGAIRVWDAATMMPRQGVMRHPTGAVQAVAVSGDGLLVASAAESSVRLWRVDDGTLTAELEMNGTAALALGFSADGQLLAVGDAAGQVQLRNSSSGEPVGQAHAFPHPVRWIGFNADGSSLFAATDHWLHALAVADGELAVLSSRLLASGLEPAVPSADGRRVRLVGGLGTAQLSFPELALDEPEIPPLESDAPQLRADWTQVLGRRVDADGKIVPIAR